MNPRTAPVGGRLAAVAWVGYIERGETEPNYDRVVDFEEKTGYKVKVKTAACPR